MEKYRVIIAGSSSFFNCDLMKEKCCLYLENKLKTHHVIYNPQNEMLPFHKTKCSETQNEASSL